MPVVEFLGFQEEREHFYCNLFCDYDWYMPRIGVKGKGLAGLRDCVVYVIRDSVQLGAMYIKAVDADDKTATYVVEYSYRQGTTGPYKAHSSSWTVPRETWNFDRHINVYIRRLYWLGFFD